MSKVAPVTKGAIAVLHEVPAQLSLVFLVDLVLQFVSHLNLALAVVHHGVCVELLLIETLVKLPLIWSTLHHVI